MRKRSDLYLDSALADPRAVGLASGFEFAFNADSVGVVSCASCGAKYGVLKFRFHEGDLRVMAFCQSCAAGSTDLSVDPAVSAFGEVVKASSWRDALNFGFQRWQFAQAENPVLIRAESVDVAATAFEVAFGALHDFLKAR